MNFLFIAMTGTFYWSWMHFRALNFIMSMLNYQKQVRLPHISFVPIQNSVLSLTWHWVQLMGLTSIVALHLQRDRHHEIGKEVYHKIAWLAHLLTFTSSILSVGGKALLQMPHCMQMLDSLISKSQIKNFIWLMLVLGLVIIFSFHTVVCATTLLSGALQIFNELFHAISYSQFIFMPLQPS